ncbi:MAG: hypothetical protein PWR29_939 [Methanolobus sp.]|nr:hypothetical protein [Methanolobus sp.]
MNRTKLNYIVDIPLLAQSFIVSLSGVILMYGGKGISYLDWTEGNGSICMNRSGSSWLHSQSFTSYCTGDGWPARPGVSSVPARTELPLSVRWKRLQRLRTVPAFRHSCDVLRT